MTTPPLFYFIFYFILGPGGKENSLVKHECVRATNFFLPFHFFFFLTHVTSAPVDADRHATIHTPSHPIETSLNKNKRTNFDDLTNKAKAISNIIHSRDDRHFISLGLLRRLTRSLMIMIDR